MECLIRSAKVLIFEDTGIMHIAGNSENSLRLDFGGEVPARPLVDPAAAPKPADYFGRT
jgi:hypothetical protein